MNETQISLIQDSFTKVAPIKDAAAEIFYADLFATAPEVKPYFKDAVMAEQGSKLIATLAVVVNGLRDLDKIVPVAQQLAIRHIDYGVQPEDYEKVGASLLRTLEKGLGDDWNPELYAAWAAAYTVLATVMKEAAYG